MEFGVVLLSIVPVRNQPSDKSEMTTQLLFGELVVIEQKYEQWLKIRNVFDNYEGWVDIKQVTKIDAGEFERLKNNTRTYIHEVADVLENISDNCLMPVVLGSSIPASENGKFEMGGKLFAYSGQIQVGNEPPDFSILAESAMLFKNAPYLWGGKTPFGVDCSGLVQVVFMLAGIQLLRDASQQATHGETIAFIAESKPGDLAFFDNEEGRIVHVGMILENNHIIHASGKVRVDEIDHQGIYNRELKKYSHQLRLIKRIL